MLLGPDLTDLVAAAFGTSLDHIHHVQSGSSRGPESMWPWLGRANRAGGDRRQADSTSVSTADVYSFTVARLVQLSPRKRQRSRWPVCSDARWLT